MPCLLFTVEFLDGRYHGLEPDGRPEWPPSPARLFQALMASAARGAALAAEDKNALAWLERLDPPCIAAPPRHKGQAFGHFMPNNDLDTKGGDPARVSEIRSATKRFHPQIFDREMPFLYLWSFDNGREYAERMDEIGLRLFQLGRGVDMAWAVADILDGKEANNRLAAYPGAIYRPTRNSGGRQLACPVPGSLMSLIDRYEGGRARFKPIIEAAPTNKKDPTRTKVIGHTFDKPPKPRFRKVFYDSLPVRLLYELRDIAKNAGFLVWPLEEVVRLVEIVRNDAAERMKKAFPDEVAKIEQVFGLCRGAIEADKARRVRIIPLPSIGHAHADRGIRRLFVEIPPDCPLAARDIEWAFSVTGAIDNESGEINWMLTSAEEQNMLGHYGIGGPEEDARIGFRIWRTVTPMALPIPHSQGRKKGSERAEIEHNAATGVVRALRHAGIPTKPASIRVQRKPFDTKGMRAEKFAPGTRFSSARLWHVEITFPAPVSGPLLAGDGRYLGLGLLRPIKHVEGVHAFAIADGLAHHTDSQSISRALRRAVMKRVQDRIGQRASVPTFFTGHEANGSTARRGGRSHLAFVHDAPRQRLLIFAPHLLEGRQPSQTERHHLALLEVALAGLRELRSGPAGLLKLEPSAIIEDDDPLFAHAKSWATQTDYRPTRYSKNTTLEQAIIADICLELRRRGVQIPASIKNIRVTCGPRGGLNAKLGLLFSTAVRGPLLLGKDSNFGGGLFVGSR